MGEKLGVLYSEKNR